MGFRKIKKWMSAILLAVVVISTVSPLAGASSCYHFGSQGLKRVIIDDPHERAYDDTGKYLEVFYIELRSGKNSQYKDKEFARSIAQEVHDGYIVVQDDLPWAGVICDVEYLSKALEAAGEDKKKSKKNNVKITIHDYDYEAYLLEHYRASECVWHPMQKFPEYSIMGYYGYSDRVSTSQGIKVQDYNVISNFSTAVEIAGRSFDYCDQYELSYISQLYDEESFAKFLMENQNGGSVVMKSISTVEYDESVREHGKASRSERFLMPFGDLMHGAYGESSSSGIIRIRIDDLSYFSPEGVMMITRYIIGYGLYEKESWGNIPYEDLYPVIYDNLQDGNNIILVRYNGEDSNNNIVVSEGNGWSVTKEAGYGIIALRIMNPEITSDEDEVEAIISSIEKARGKSFDILTREALKYAIKSKGASISESIRFLSEEENVSEEKRRQHNVAVAGGVLEVEI